MRKKSKIIYIVDDDKAILHSISLLLKEEGYEIILIDTYEQFMQLLQQENESYPDLILLDVMLEGMDGRVVLKQLKSGNDTYDIPIIVISANSTTKESVQKEGANEFLTKPFEADELFRLIRKYI